MEDAHAAPQGRGQRAAQEQTLTKVVDQLVTLSELLRNPRPEFRGPWEIFEGGDRADANPVEEDRVQLVDEVPAPPAPDAAGETQESQGY